MKNPARPPTTLKTCRNGLAVRKPGGVTRHDPLSISDPTNDTKVNKPKIASTQEPTDIGDHHLNIGRKVLDWTIMCQKRSGLVRSMISSGAHNSAAGKAMK